MDIYSRNLHGKIETLEDAPGIPELMELYYDAGYNYETGDFKEMTAETQISFNEDLKKFYKIFTGNDDMPSIIKKFSDIKLKEYNKSKICDGKNPLFGQGVKGTYKNKLFADYADNLKQMMNSVNGKQEQLLEIINQLFVYVKDTTKIKSGEENSEVIRVNPDLTEEKLQALILETRTIIVELYLKCEEDFIEGVKLYEAIIESQILETAQKQIATLESEVVNLYNPYKASNIQKIE
jgi:hypothetical protein